MRTKLLVLVGVAAVALSSCAGSRTLRRTWGRRRSRRTPTCPAMAATRRRAMSRAASTSTGAGTARRMRGLAARCTTTSTASSTTRRSMRTRRGFSRPPRTTPRSAGRATRVHSWTCENGVQTFTTQSSSSDRTTRRSRRSVGWTRVGLRVCRSVGLVPAVGLHAVPGLLEGHVKQGTYGCSGGSIVSGGDFGFNLVGSQVCAPVFKDQGGTGTDGFGIPHGLTEGRYSVRFRVQSGASTTRSRGCCGRMAIRARGSWTSRRSRRTSRGRFGVHAQDGRDRRDDFKSSGHAPGQRLACRDDRAEELEQSATCWTATWWVRARAICRSRRCTGCFSRRPVGGVHVAAAFVRRRTSPSTG
jgi:hypothetical protein